MEKEREQYIMDWIDATIEEADEHGMSFTDWDVDVDALSDDSYSPFIDRETALDFMRSKLDELYKLCRNSK